MLKYCNVLKFIILQLFTLTFFHIFKDLKLGYRILFAPFFTSLS